MPEWGQLRKAKSSLQVLLPEEEEEQENPVPAAVIPPCQSTTLAQRTEPGVAVPDTLTVGARLLSNAPRHAEPTAALHDDAPVVVPMEDSPFDLGQMVRVVKGSNAGKVGVITAKKGKMTLTVECNDGAMVMDVRDTSVLPVDPDVPTGNDWKVNDSDYGGEGSGQMRVTLLQTVKVQSLERNTILSHVFGDRLLAVKHSFDARDEESAPEPLLTLGESVVQALDRAASFFEFGCNCLELRSQVL